MVDFVILISLGLFTVITVLYTILTIYGLIYKRSSYKENEFSKKIESRNYPSVDVFVPAYNEGVVIKDTIEAMLKLNYIGELQIYILNDNSTDETGEIVEKYCKRFKNLHLVNVPDGEPKGKSRVLNHGLSIGCGEYFVVYDGDNRPEPNALQYLVDASFGQENVAGAVGVVKTINANSNWLTRMIAIEFQVFQLVLQAGRWRTLEIGSLPGTNMLLKKSVVMECGGYDEYALAEDAELTIRLTAAKQKIVVEPKSVTWEQEPESLRALVKQRTRWLQGNLYLSVKFLKHISWWKSKCMHHFSHYLIVYIMFPIILFPCNAIFILGILNLIELNLKIPFFIIWFMMYFVYTIQIVLAMWFDGTLSMKNTLVAFTMYFTYAQLFSYIFLRGVLMFLLQSRKKKVEWDKTERVAI